MGIKQESLSGLEIWAFVHQKDPERMREPSLVASGSLEVEKQEDEAWSQGKQALLRPPLFTGVAGNCEGFLSQQGSDCWSLAQCWAWSS